MDDRVCIHYIVERLDGILGTKDQEPRSVPQGLLELRQELLHNLGVNERLRKTTVRCAHCQSEDVWRSRISYWSKDRGAWIDEEFSDDYGCNACGHNELEFFTVVSEEERDGRG